MAKIICGVDVASRSLEVRSGSDGPAHSFAHSPEGIADLATFCPHHHVDLVAREATRGYEQQPFSLLWADGIPALLLLRRRCVVLPRAWACWKKPTAATPA